jgi:hypothetical protein
VSGDQQRSAWLILHDKWLCEDQSCMDWFHKIIWGETLTVLEILPGICSNA